MVQRQLACGQSLPQSPHENLSWPGRRVLLKVIRGGERSRAGLPVRREVEARGERPGRKMGWPGPSQGLDALYLRLSRRGLRKLTLPVTPCDPYPPYLAGEAWRPAGAVRHGGRAGEFELFERGPALELKKFHKCPTSTFPFPDPIIGG